jgi:hypothetical protein
MQIDPSAKYHQGAREQKVEEIKEDLADAFPTERKNIKKSWKK